MKRVLALDVSARWGGVALVEADRAKPPRVRVEVGFDERDHARVLLGWIDAVLRRAGLGRDDVDAFVATHGPGSFTGLRIGLGTVRGLAVAARKPCCGVGTLQAMAEAFGPAEAVRVPLLAAGRGEVFGACFDGATTPPIEQVAPRVGPPATVLGELTRDEPSVVFGSGVEDLLETLPAEARVGVAPRGIAAAAARLAILSGFPPDSLSPVYLRPPDALVPR